MRASLILVPLVLAGCFTPKYHAPHNDDDRTGVFTVNDGSDAGTRDLLAMVDSGSGAANELAGELYVEFQNDADIINTDRGHVLIADANTSCDEIWSWARYARQSLASLEEPWIDWRYDADMCAFASEQPVAIPVRAASNRSTVAFLGYNVDSAYLSLFTCNYVDGTDWVELLADSVDPFYSAWPARCPSVSARCDGACVVDTSSR